jgi:GNAT superfamily N-acetyltransferase
MKNLKIAEFKAKDAKEVFKIIFRNLFEVNIKDYEPNVMFVMAEKHTPEQLIENSKTRKIFVATIPNYIIFKKIIGTATFEGNYINSVYVLPEYHRKGIGKKMIEHIEKIAKFEKHKILRLHSTSTALKFYQSLGYKIHHKVFNKKYGTNYFMTKEM